MADDTRIWFGRPGQLFSIPHPKGEFSAQRNRMYDIFEPGAGGARVDQMVGGARTYEIPWAGLDRATFARLQAFAEGHEGVGPFALLDPGQRNMLPVNMSGATSQTNDVTNFAVAGSGCVIGSSSLYTDAGPRSLRWTFNYAAPGTGAALTPVWPSSVFRFGVPVVSGRALCFSAYVRGGGTDQIVTYTPQLIWRDVTGALLSTTSGTPVASDNVDFIRMFATGTPPANTVYVDWKIQYTSGASAGSIGFWRRFLLNEGSTPDTTWTPGTGVWPVKVVGLDESWLGRFPDYRTTLGFQAQEDTS